MTSQQHMMRLEMGIHMIQTKCNFLLMDSEAIHPGQIALLMTMREMGASNQRALARRMNCSPASVGVSVKRLERAGLLRKQADEQDMRTTRVALTKQGLDLAQRCERVVNAVSEKKYNGFSQKELDQMEGYLSRIRVNLEEYQAALTALKREREPDRVHQREYGRRVAESDMLPRTHGDSGRRGERDDTFRCGQKSDVASDGRGRSKPDTHTGSDGKDSGDTDNK